MTPETLPTTEQKRDELFYKIHQYLNDPDNTLKWSEGTILNYHADLSLFAEFCQSQGIAKVSLLKPEHVNHWILQLKAKYKPATVARRTAAVKGFVKWENAKGNLSAEFEEKIENLKVSKNLPRILTWEETQKVTAAIPYLIKNGFWGLRDALIIQLSFKGGLKVTEIIRLKLGNVKVNADNGSVNLEVRNHKSGKVKTTELDEQTSELVIRYLRKDGWIGKEEPFLTNKNKSQLTRQGFWIITKEIGKELGIGNLTPIVLRHTGKAYNRLINKQRSVLPVS